MRAFGKSPRTGLVLIVASAFLMQGCAAAAVATAAAGGGLAYSFSREQPETAAGEPDPSGQATVETESLGTDQPVVLVEPQAPIESVEVQPIQ
jgi:hypothetical protein